MNVGLLRQMYVRFVGAIFDSIEWQFLLTHVFVDNLRVLFPRVFSFKLREYTVVSAQLPLSVVTGFANAVKMTFLVVARPLVIALRPIIASIEVGQVVAEVGWSAFGHS